MRYQTRMLRRAVPTMANGIDSMKIEKMGPDRYRILLTGEGLTVDALLIGRAAESIIKALEAEGDPRPVLAAYKARAKKGGRPHV